MLHATVLLGCSATGLGGYYLQHGRFQITACIPAAVGMLLIALTQLRMSSEKLRAWLLFSIVFAFGIVVTRLAARFVFQELQPLRKRIYFPVMAGSSMATCLVLGRWLRVNRLGEG